MMAAASKLTQEEEKELATLSDEVKPEWMENWYDGLGFCEF